MASAVAGGTRRCEQIDLTPQTEKAILWVVSLQAFVDAQGLGVLERGLAAYREHGPERATASND